MKPPRLRLKLCFAAPLPTLPSACLSTHACARTYLMVSALLLDMAHIVFVILLCALLLLSALGQISRCLAEIFFLRVLWHKPTLLQVKLLAFASSRVQHLKKNKAKQQDRKWRVSVGELGRDVFSLACGTLCFPFLLFPSCSSCCSSSLPLLFVPPPTSLDPLPLWLHAYGSLEKYLNALAGLGFVGWAVMVLTAFSLIKSLFVFVAMGGFSDAFGTRGLRCVGWGRFFGSEAPHKSQLNNIKRV